MPTLSKPLSEFYSLDKELSQQGTRFTLSAGATFLPPNRILNDATIVIQHGTASLHRNNNHILYGIVQGPVIFGLAAGVSQIHNEYMLTAESDCRGYYLAANETLECLENHQLWREAFYWMGWQTRMLELRDKQLIGTNHYHQIRSTLFMMMEWDAEIRERIGVLNYIQQRTGISRSVIAEVLSALRKGEYIQMNKGKLVSVTRLPDDY
ncbi:TPA: helix-turn-helix domain-containing protein [Kluyvera cryocrescens]|uniref:Inhibitor of hydrogen peroxide resistance n=1 Tax=Kluyvera cryocrescens TaxID=580 RepID=A0AAW9C7H4_KLUCR|nr:helix-turn-helix domain-containing protein [Kluyvera cryocrescens]MCX2868380.1 helix-turn-helix domain-containing protein [Kluyvera cryocrescens]MDW3777478.1 helix-turn-helix domain-containing protein [Kluyvera cryocrescens]MEB6631251.1 helix-turn-helix domain-containing protein [Kluyvera cryocrescens]MEB7555042.1 helix-turn-helix domain-containing protein [Kluyvera cryocrescens]MEB7711222.1 helix-turn-helix domain-containing protein [Kluyvera cryocrescens]